METNEYRHITSFFIIGINYKKTDASIRGQFAINADQYEALLQTAKKTGFSELFVLSTCNRTEVYGFAHHPSQLINLLCAHTAGDAATFAKLAYIKHGSAAIEHLYSVAAGLDSQILGDYEIVGQMKLAARFAKERGCIGAFTERLLNSALQSSKMIKNHTELSGGTVSVSFAAVQYIRSMVQKPSAKNILLLGIGKIGRNTCKNLVDYLQTSNITLINRSPEKAQELAAELGLKHAVLENLQAEIAKADIILVATNAAEPTILREHLEGSSNKLIIDLSIPYNVAPDAQALTNVQLVNVDELSKLKDETLKMREREIPKAKTIIAGCMLEFEEWQQMRRHAPLLKATKLKLKEIRSNPDFINMSCGGCSKEAEVRIQRVMADMASKIRVKNGGACHFFEAINKFMTTGTAQS
jgi:glutamyl-tRNA reductase